MYCFKCYFCLLADRGYFPDAKKTTSVSVEPGNSEGVGGLLLLAAATETGLLRQLEHALPTEMTAPRPPLAGSSATVRQRLLLTLLFLGTVGLHRGIVNLVS